MMRHLTPMAMALGLFLAVPAQAQWHRLASGTQEDLKAVSAIDAQIAWASGGHGTVLRTQDGGASWQRCAVPPGAEDLDLRGVQGFDKDTAVVMAAGSGQASRLFKTADGCRTWKVMLANPDAAGAFEALRRATAYDIYLLGQPVAGRFVVYLSHNAGDTWARETDSGLALPTDAHLAPGGASAMTNVLSFVAFGSGGGDGGAPIYSYGPLCKGKACEIGWSSKPAPMASGGVAASVAGRNIMVPATGTVTGIGTMPATALVAVGGDPRQGTGAAAFSVDGGATWKPASVAPGGYRSAVDFDGDHNRFIAVGPNGTDVSVDDGLIWAPLRSGPEGSAEDKGWAALSLPFVVGEHGRIGLLTNR